MDKIQIIMSLLKDLEREMDMTSLEDEEVPAEGVVPGDDVASKIAEEISEEDPEKEEDPEEEF